MLPLELDIFTHDQRAIELYDWLCVETDGHVRGRVLRLGRSVPLFYWVVWLIVCRNRWTRTPQSATTRSLCFSILLSCIYDWLCVETDGHVRGRVLRLGRSVPLYSHHPPVQSYHAQTQRSGLGQVSYTHVYILSLFYSLASVVFYWQQILYFIQCYCHHHYLRNRLWGGCVYVLQMFFFCFLFFFQFSVFPSVTKIPDNRSRELLNGFPWNFYQTIAGKM